MSLSKKLRIAMLQLNVNQVELSNRTNQSQANLSRKIVADNFNFAEYERLVHALGCTLEVNIVLPDGSMI